MALVSLSSTEEAVSCLVGMHNYAFPEGGYLRVSFSRRQDIVGHNNPQ